uniref:hypothetical protein n=1 Tax=Planctomicrobium sp. SH664 TaxID=3448125 RepID=UPI003F5BDC36
MTFEPGDIAACHGTDWTSRVIRWSTASFLPPRRLMLGPSHVAMICSWQGEQIWVESTRMCRTNCLIHGRPVSGAQAHLPGDRIADYVLNGGRVDLYRLTAVNRLSHDEQRLLTALLMQFFVIPGVNYDLGGALLSGTRVFQWSRLFPRANLEQLFCSELVAAVVMRLNRMNHANPTRFNPARLLRTLVQTGKYEFVQSLAGTR